MCVLKTKLKKGSHRSCHRFFSCWYSYFCWTWQYCFSYLGFNWFIHSGVYHLWNRILFVFWNLLLSCLKNQILVCKIWQELREPVEVSSEKIICQYFIPILFSEKIKHWRREFNHGLILYTSLLEDLKLLEGMTQFQYFNYCLLYTWNFFITMII